MSFIFRNSKSTFAEAEAKKFFWNNRPIINYYQNQRLFIYMNNKKYIRFRWYMYQLQKQGEQVLSIVMDLIDLVEWFHKLIEPFL